MSVPHVDIRVHDIPGTGAMDGPLTAAVNGVLGVVNDGVNLAVDGLNDAERIAIAGYDAIRDDAIKLAGYVDYIGKLMLIEARGVVTYLTNVVYQLLGPNALKIGFETCFIVLAVVGVVVGMGVLGGTVAWVRFLL